MLRVTDRLIVGIIAILAWIIRLSSSASRPDSLAGISSLHYVSNADDCGHSDLPAIDGYFDQCRKLVSDNALLLTADTADKSAFIASIFDCCFVATMSF